MKPVWPIVSGEQRLPPDQPGCAHCQPIVRVGGAGRRSSAMAAGESSVPVEQPVGEIEHAIHGAEQPGMAGDAAEREGVLVMHRAAHHAPAPLAALGRDGAVGAGRDREPVRQREFARAGARAGARAACRAG